MLNTTTLADLLAIPSLKRSDRLLLALGSLGRPATVKEITDRCKAAGHNAVAKWNVSDILAGVPTLARRAAKTWFLTSAGQKHVETLGLPGQGSALVKHTDNVLAATIAKIVDNMRRTFLEEAQTCFQTQQHRAAVVLSWVGAAWILQTHVISTLLVQFNAAGTARFGGGKYPFRPIATIEDFGRLKEADFLLLLEDIGLIGKSLHKQLKERLDLRNGCGHPNSMIMDAHTVAAHVHFLCNNVYLKY